MQSNGFDRVVMRVNDLGGLALRLRRLGYTITDVRDVAMGYRMAVATDPDGYKLELVETATWYPKITSAVFTSPPLNSEIV